MRRLGLAAALGCLVVLLLSPVSEGSRAGGIVWAADGVFASGADGSDVRQLVPMVSDQHFDPAWSPDGRTLAFSGRRSDQADLYLYDAATRAHRLLDVRGRWAAPRRGRVFSYLLEASWAPDGGRLALSDFWSPAFSTVKVVSLRDRRLRPLTTPRSGRSDSSPAWAPERMTIALVRRESPSWVPVIMLVQPDGSGLRRLTRGASPSWSPDGRRLVFAWGSSIYRIDADGSDRVRLARALSLSGDALQPRWSPDGRRILYVAGPRAIVTMDVDGTNRTRVRLPRTVAVGGVAWRPR